MKQALQNAISNLVEISRYCGMREDLVQAGGGNTSIKIDSEKMLIKASGYQLADVSQDSGFCAVNQKIIIDFFKSTPIEKISKDDEKALLQNATLNDISPKPSIETFLHAFTKNATIHSHCVLAAFVCCKKNWQQELKKIFPKALLIPYATPGIELAKECFKAFSESKNNLDSEIIFLQNHGLLVSAKSAQDVINLHEEVLEKLQKHFGFNDSKNSVCTQIWRALKENGIDEIAVLMQNKNIYAAFEKFGVFEHCICPDCVVYCGAKVMILDENFDAKSIKDFCNKYGKPSVAFYNNHFYSIAPSVKKAKEVESLFAFAAEVLLLNNNQNLNFLPESEKDFLLNWDAEKYRKSLK